MSGGQVRDPPEDVIGPATDPAAYFDVRDRDAGELADGQFYSCYTLDDDLDLFFNVLRLFKTYEYEVDGSERSISPIKLDEFLAEYKF